MKCNQLNYVTAPDKRILNDGDVLPKKQGMVDGHSYCGGGVWVWRGLGVEGCPTVVSFHIV